MVQLLAPVPSIRYPVWMETARTMSLRGGYFCGAEQGGNTSQWQGRWDTAGTRHKQGCLNPLNSPAYPPKL